jgi:CubicO group peptidase (beta-lactamase class C family)
MRIGLLILAFFLAVSSSVSAQSIQQRKTDSVFKLVAKYFDSKQADSIYALAGVEFKKALSRETFRYICEKQLFPLGIIKESSLISFVNDRDATYKVVFASGILQLQMNLDSKGKLYLFLFQPYKKEAEDKLKRVPSTNPMKTLADRQVDSAVRPYIQKSNTVGLSIGILRNGVITTYNYGETKQGNNILPDANSIFEIGSISKTFTATLLAYYVNEGKVTLKDSIAKYLPDSVAANKAIQGITLEMLSNHTSGLPRLPDNLENHSLDPRDPYKDYNQKDLYDYLKTCKLNSSPGEKYAYSNLGVGLLGIILEKVSGKSYQQMVEEIICKPLGMNSTAEYLTPAEKARFVTVYNDEGQETSPWTFDILAPCGALRSTVTDLLIYAKANLQPSDSKLSKAIQLTHQVTFSNKDLKLGLGWHVIKIAGVEYYFHNGGTFGCSSYLVFNPDKKFAVAVLSNSGESVDKVGADIVKRLQQ